MKSPRCLLIAALVGFAGGVAPLVALDRPDTTFAVHQFPRDAIPRIDGDAADWADVPESRVVTLREFVDATGRYAQADDANLAVRLRVGWVAGLNRLYFLYEASDDCWDYAASGLHNDTLELIVDGDASGGVLVGPAAKSVRTPEEIGAAAAAPEPRIDPAALFRAVQGVHAQNYHVFTPAVGKDWCMAWNAATWTKEFPWANAAASRTPPAAGGAGKYTLEFWITPFDHADADGPARSVETVLRENAVLGLGVIVIDYDQPAGKERGFWMLGRNRLAYGNASRLCAFRLLPLDAKHRKPLEARWSFAVVDADRRLVAFKDESYGEITAWRWDFGDGTTSTERHPVHVFKEWSPERVVSLEVEGPAGRQRFERVWDVQTR